MDLRTFFKPKTINVAPLPDVGDPAPAALTAEGQPQWGTIVAFMRHIGCPFAEATFRRLKAAAEDYHQIQFVAVSHGTQKTTDYWLASLGTPGRTQIIVDNDRELYAAWGLGLTEMKHWIGGDSLSAVGKLRKKGIKNRHPSGSRWQGAGTFALDRDGIIRWRHIPDHAGDLPDLRAAIAVLKPAR